MTCDDAKVVADLLESLRQYHERGRRGWRWWPHEDAEARRLGRICIVSNEKAPTVDEILANMEALKHLIPRKP